MLYFEISILLLLTLTAAAVAAAVIRKNYVLLPFISFLIFSGHAIIEGWINKVGIGGLIGWVVSFTAIVSVCSWSVWIARKMTRR